MADCWEGRLLPGRGQLINRRSGWTTGVAHTWTSSRFADVSLAFNSTSLFYIAPSDVITLLGNPIGAGAVYKILQVNGRNCCTNIMSARNVIIFSIIINVVQPLSPVFGQRHQRGVSSSASSVVSYVTQGPSGTRKDCRSSSISVVSF